MFIVQPSIPQGLLNFNSPKNASAGCIVNAAKLARTHDVPLRMLWDEHRLILELPAALFGSEHPTYEAACIEAGRLLRDHRISAAVLRKEGADAVPLIRFTPVQP